VIFCVSISVNTPDQSVMLFIKDGAATTETENSRDSSVCLKKQS